MRNPIVFIFISVFLCLWQGLVAQAEEPVEAKEMQAFTRVYFAEKEINASYNKDSVFLSILDRSGVSTDRFPEIFHSRLEGKEASLNNREEEAFSEIEERNLQQEIETRKRLSIFCEKNGITIERYVEMKRRFRSEIAFQRMAKPYFDEILEH